MSDKLRDALAMLDIDPRVADHLVKIRDDVEAAYRSEIERLTKERDEYRNALRGILNHCFVSYDAHGPSRSVEDRQWQIGFTDGVRDCSNKAGAGIRAGLHKEEP